MSEEFMKKFSVEEKTQGFSVFGRALLLTVRRKSSSGLTRRTATLGQGSLVMNPKCVMPMAITQKKFPSAIGSCEIEATLKMKRVGMMPITGWELVEASQRDMEVLRIGVAVLAKEDAK